MKMPVDRRSFLHGACVLPLLNTSVLARAAPLPIRTVTVPAPFDMPSIAVPDFRMSRTFLITDFGASSADKAKTSASIARAIDAANAAGSGIVVVPAGTWPTGKIHLKSNVNLHLAKGATLRFSDEPQDYLPAVQTSVNGGAKVGQRGGVKAGQSRRALTI